VERWGYGSRRALLAGAALAGAIVLYNSWHKGNPLGPVLMGLCRALLYLTAGLALAARPGPELTAGAVVLLCYLIGLTYVAKQETLTRLPNTWPLFILATPFAYAASSLFDNVSVTVLYVAFLAWVLYALSILVRRLSIGKAVVTLIAGISLLDAVLIARTGAEGLAWIAAAGLVVTVFFQRYIRGT
jgi:4-hydroxybenzoate polyprenyltransferase